MGLSEIKVSPGPQQMMVYHHLPYSSGHLDVYTATCPRCEKTACSGRLLFGRHAADEDHQGQVRSAVAVDLPHLVAVGHQTDGERQMVACYLPSGYLTYIIYDHQSLVIVTRYIYIYTYTYTYTYIYTYIYICTIWL